MANGQMDIQGRIQEVRDRVEQVRPDILPQVRDAVQQRVQRRSGPLSQAADGGLLEQARSGLQGGGSGGGNPSPNRGEKFRSMDQDSGSRTRRSTRDGGHRSIT